MQNLRAECSACFSRSLTSSIYVIYGEVRWYHYYPRSWIFDSNYKSVWYKKIASTLLFVTDALDPCAAFFSQPRRARSYLLVEAFDLFHHFRLCCFKHYIQCSNPALCFNRFQILQVISVFSRNAWSSKPSAPSPHARLPVAQRPSSTSACCCVRRGVWVVEPLVTPTVCVCVWLK
jgi:hypothetical protein